MKNLKTYEGFFDFLKSKPSADDEIALEYIARLKKVRGISPYKITFEEGTGNNDSHKVNKYIIFHDTSKKLIAYINDSSNLPFTPSGGNVTLQWDNGVNKIFKL